MFFKKFLENCSKTEIKIICVPLVDNGSITNDKELEFTVKFFNKFKTTLIKNNQKIAFESDFEPNKLSNFVSRFDSKCFGINYDIGNSAGLGYSYLDELNKYHNRIINVHVKDKNYKNQTVPLGTGIAKIVQVIKYLKRKKYNGNFILQPARCKRPGQDLNIIIKYFKKYKKWI